MLGNFTSWKIFCSESGVASTNNALESFNCIIKKSSTLNARHPLSALVDILIERLVFDITMDIKDLRKCFETRQCPAKEVKQKSEKIDDLTYKICEQGDSMVTYQKSSKSIIYSVSCCDGTCTCRYFLKMGYCKHLLHAHSLLNKDSDYIIIDQQFKYKGNTKITKRQRGRVMDALPALQLN